MCRSKPISCRMGLLRGASVRDPLVRPVKIPSFSQHRSVVAWLNHVIRARAKVNRVRRPWRHTMHEMGASRMSRDSRLDPYNRTCDKSRGVVHSRNHGT